MEKKQHLHEKREITFQELGALLGTRALIEQKQVVHDGGNDYAEDGVHKINMSVSCRINHCGTVGCIGGTMGLLMGMDPNSIENYVRGAQYRRPIGALFYPPTPHTSYTNDFYRSITPDKMLAAIDNFLKYGSPRWKSLFPKIRRWS